MKGFFRHRPIQNAVGYFLAAAFASRFVAVLTVYPIAAAVGAPSGSLNADPIVVTVTTMVQGFVFAFTSLWFLRHDRPGRPMTSLAIMSVLILAITADNAGEVLKASGQFEYGSPEWDTALLTSAALGVLVFLIPYSVGRLVFRPLHRRWRESENAF